MKKIILLLLQFSFCLQLHAATEVNDAGKFGIGFGGGNISGEGAGFSLRYNSSETLQLQGVVNFFNGGMALSADGLFPMANLLDNNDLDINFYLGVGPDLVLFNNSSLGSVFGIHGNVGLDFGLASIPLNLAIEYRPIVVFNSGTNLNFDNVVGHIRYFF